MPEATFHVDREARAGIPHRRVQRESCPTVEPRAHCVDRAQRGRIGIERLTRRRDGRVGGIDRGAAKHVVSLAAVNVDPVALRRRVRTDEARRCSTRRRRGRRRRRGGGGGGGGGGGAPTGSKNKPLTTALALEPVRVVIVISTFPDIAQVRYLPLAKLDTVCVFSIALVLASLSVTVSDRPLPS